jgi:hypothetical protein
VLLIKLFLVPIFIAVVALCGRVWGAGAAGMLSGLPIIAGPIVFFMYLENGLNFARGAAGATVAGITALSSFCFSYSWLCIRYSWQYSLFWACVIYFAVALAIGALNLSLTQAVITSASVILAQIYFSPKLDKLPFTAPASTNEILFRMCFALILVLVITWFAESLGYTYSGIFAAFPVAGSTIALFSHRNYSALHAVRSLKSMKQGLISMLAFFFVLTVSADKVDFSVALLISACVALGLQVIILYLKRNYKAC